MSEQPAKIRLFWLLIVAVLALALGFLVRGCGKKPGPVYIPVDLDSLRTAWEATFPKDTLILPGQITHTTKTRVVNLKDTAEVNALRRELEENAAYSAAQLASLQGAERDFGRAKESSRSRYQRKRCLRFDRRVPSITTTYGIGRRRKRRENQTSPLRRDSDLPDLFPSEPLARYPKHRIGAFAGSKPTRTWRQV
ncbi:MAG: hypothetical protein IPH04_14910 [Saprospirales bacterium]|nr:hypothetical protein [Saprospirales bacterium]